MPGFNEKKLIICLFLSFQHMAFECTRGKEEKEISLRIHHSEMQEVPAGDILFLK